MISELTFRHEIQIFPKKRRRRRCRLKQLQTDQDGKHTKREAGSGVRSEVYADWLARLPVCLLDGLLFLSAFVYPLGYSRIYRSGVVRPSLKLRKSEVQEERLSVWIVIRIVKSMLIMANFKPLCDPLVYYGCS